MKLEIGSGKRPTPGYTHLDIKPLEGIDIVADARKIPLPDNECEEVYSHWVLEHFSYHDTFDLLTEWKRILKPGGIVKIITSNQPSINTSLLNKEITFEE